MIQDLLPRLRGRITENAPLGPTTWFRVGGRADILFRPADADDLAVFLKEKPADMAVTVLGVASNVLVRDEGIAGAVVRLGSGFADIEREGNSLVVGAGALDLNVALSAQLEGIGGLEFLAGIPGTIGGGVRMNAGAYGGDMAGRLLWVEALDQRGVTHRLSPAELGMTYRHCAVPEGWIFTRVALQGEAEDPETIAARIAEIQRQRAETQPVRARTGGSTFTNPPGAKAWELIDRAGCRGLRLGGAQVSEQHCNFLINAGDASAADLEQLGEEVRRRVKAVSGHDLQWEIRRLGRPVTEVRAA
ncbi:MAG TPA: UDP-N-acetylmuramate dehydrogenase [Dongiaceae bacterium]|jgi:UDP-N-acetylmuramate dehydrogenase|nr:UDP-N-acetylmuramate dehydrogenase [Dongiaceae bacterium]